MASFKMYRIVTTTTSTPMNVVTGTTGTPSTPFSPDDKGVEATFQNLSTAATNIWIGGSTMTSIAIGATSTLGASGIVVAQNGTYSIGHRTVASAVQMNDFYIASTSSNAICSVMLVKAV